MSADDLLIHKMIKLRTDRRRLLQDLADLRALLDARGSAVDWDYLRKWLPAPEAEFLVGLATLDDEAAAARLFAPRP